MRYADGGAARSDQPKTVSATVAASPFPNAASHAMSQREHPQPQPPPMPQPIPPQPEQPEPDDDDDNGGDGNDDDPGQSRGMMRR